MGYMVLGILLSLVGAFICLGAVGVGKDVFAGCLLGGLVPLAWGLIGWAKANSRADIIEFLLSPKPPEKPHTCGHL
jgi:hypothetical protein